MEDLNATVEADLVDTIEGEFGTKVNIIYSSGSIQEYSKNNPEKYLKGMFRYYKLGINPDTGEGLVIDNPSILLRLSSMDEKIEDGDKAVMEITVSSFAGSPVLQFVVEESRATEGSSDFGEIMYYLKQVGQET